MAEKTDQLAHIPLNKVRYNPVALRPVDKEKTEYLEMCDSVRKHGILLPILVREFEEEGKPGEKLYSIIDGLQRYNCALDNGLSTIPARVTSMDQAEVEETQIIANAHKIETKPIQYATALERLIQRKPTMSIQELADMVSKDKGWITKMFNLNKRLHDDLKPLVDDKKIPVGHAYELSKLPTGEQKEWQDKATTLSLGEFTANVAQRLKDIRDARNKGKAEGPAEFQPVPNARKWTDVRDQFLAGCPQIIQAVKAKGVTDPVEVVKFALAWVCRMDPASQAEQIQADKAAKEKRAADAERRKLEKTNAKIDEATKLREELQKKVEQHVAA